jgi:hypothetical protein
MAKAQTEPPALYVVLESFTTDIDGVPTAYRKGEPIHPDDPLLRRMPSAFGPLAFPHPVKRATMTPPEVRAD